jgi:hypothetical protein
MEDQLSLMRSRLAKPGNFWHCVVLHHQPTDIIPHIVGVAKEQNSMIRVFLGTDVEVKLMNQRLRAMGIEAAVSNWESLGISLFSLIELRSATAKTAAKTAATFRPNVPVIVIFDTEPSFTQLGLFGLAELLSSYERDKQEDLNVRIISVGREYHTGLDSVLGPGRKSQHLFGGHPALQFADSGGDDTVKKGYDALQRGKHVVVFDVALAVQLSEALGKSDNLLRVDEYTAREQLEKLFTGQGPASIIYIDLDIFTSPLPIANIGLVICTVVPRLVFDDHLYDQVLVEMWMFSIVVVNRDMTARSYNSLEKLSLGDSTIGPEDAAC